jgi:hypothetical protein
MEYPFYNKQMVCLAKEQTWQKRKEDIPSYDLRRSY